MDARPVKLSHPFQNALARQFVVLTETSEFWQPLPAKFAGPNWLEMPNANAKTFYRIRQYDSGASSTVILACTESGSVCVVKFHMLEGMSF